jgi:hypothetical protein
MLIRIPRNWNDKRGKDHRGITRRDFIHRGLITSSVAAVLPHTLLGSWIQNAEAATTCPPQVRKTGLLAQVFREGGPTIGGSSPLHSIQATGMTANAAANYGIVQADIVQTGANWYVSKSSPFGASVLAPPPGYTQTTWNAVLKLSSLGGHYGPFGADDGAGVDLGHLGAAARFKASAYGKDVRIANGNAKAIWAEGQPAASTGTDPGNLTVSTLAGKFGITPSGGITPQVMTNAATAADSLSSIFSSVFNLGARKMGPQTVTNAVCGFYGDSALATTGLGASLFDPTKITALSGATIQVASLPAAQQALFAAFYQSAIGSVGAVILEQGGGDYHNSFDLAFFTANVAPYDFETGTYVAMFLAACDAAKVPGAMIIVANGNCGCEAPVATTINTNLNVMVPATTGGDQGGNFNGGLILCYNPSSPPVLKTTGTFSMADGSVTASPSVFGVPQGLAGLYLTAFTYLGLDVAGATAAMQGVGINNPSGLLLI